VAAWSVSPTALTKIRVEEERAVEKSRRKIIYSGP
jgi:hypothetical protein